ncbi:hypothetical protein [Dankookia sp. P2]|uniref:hypothetical protein n=1 Tax=Dankookia sp. P2 TaxID=3423955 RepID=UPI003D67C915
MTLQPYRQRQPAALRVHLALAAEARRRGDYAAAEQHETDAVIALRFAVAAAQTAEASHHA